MPKKRTHEEFVYKVRELVGDEYEVLERYKNSATKIKLLHNKCGREYITTPNSFIQGHRCNLCYQNHTKTQEEFVEEVKNLFGNEYVVLGKYVNVKTKIRILHVECQKEYETDAGVVLRGFGCPHCAGSIVKTTEQFKKEVFNLVGEEYDVLGEYINSGVKIKMVHNIFKNSKIKT